MPWARYWLCHAGGLLHPTPLKLYLAHIVPMNLVLIVPSATFLAARSNQPRARQWFAPTKPICRIPHRKFDGLPITTVVRGYPVGCIIHIHTPDCEDASKANGSCRRKKHASGSRDHSIAPPRLEVSSNRETSRSVLQKRSSRPGQPFFALFHVPFNIPCSGRLLFLAAA